MALAELGDNLLVMNVDGAFTYVSAAFELRSLQMDLPTNRAGLERSRFNGVPDFILDYNFRSHDLLAVEVSPQVFDLYATYDRFADTCFEFVLARIRLNVTESEIRAEGEWEDVFVAEPCMLPKASHRPFAGHQIGGRVELLNRDTLIVSLGDGEFDGFYDEDAPQDPNSDLGKVIAIRLSTGVAEHWARGFRNPQGLLVDSQGRVWQSEHGPVGGDEVNLLRSGGNYGWPRVTYGLPYAEPYPNMTYQSHAGYDQPALAITPAVGPSQLIEPSAQEFPFWSQSLLLATMSARALYVLALNEDDIVSSYGIDMDFRIRDMIVRRNGQIAMVTDEGQMVLLRRYDEARGHETFSVTDVRSPAENRARNANLSPVERGRRIFSQACASCHSLSGAAAAGPPLNGIVGRGVGEVDTYAYSPALEAADGSWTEARIARYVRDPQREIPGTAMSEVAISSSQARDLAQYLATVSVDEP